MKIKALVSFAGKLSMVKGEITDCEHEVIFNDLIKAGYVEEVKAAEPKKDTRKNSKAKKVDDIDEN